MPKVTITKSSFTGGEWSESLFARQDLAKYQSANKVMKNFIAHPHGGASNRPGTKFVYEVDNSAEKSKLIPFSFSTVQSYVLEFSDLKMRVIMDGGIILSGGTPFELVTTYLEADLPLLKFAQSADTLYMTHPSYPPRKIQRTAHDVWTINNVTFGAVIAAPVSLVMGGIGNNYEVTTVDEKGRESLPSVAKIGAPANALSWAAVTDAEYYNIYKEINNSGTFGWIGQASGLTFTEPAALIVPDPYKTTPKQRTPFSGAGTYPSCVVFFEQRLVFFGTGDEPHSAWGSVTGDYENMNVSAPIKDDDAWRFEINSKQENAIKWAVPMNELVIGTAGGEWKMGAGGSSDSINPTSVSIKNQSQYGVTDIDPLVIGSTILFIEGSGDKVRDLLYSFEADGYKGSDLSLFANHLFAGHTIVSWAYQQNPNSIIWAVRDDGVLLGLTYYKEHEIFGWHQHDTDGFFEDVSTISNAAGGTDAYFIVKRSVNGSDVRYIEMLSTGLPIDVDFNRDIQDAFFVDSGLTYDVPLIVSAITAADPCVITVTSHGLSNGDEVDMSNIISTAVSGTDNLEDILNGKRFIVSNKTTHTFEITNSLAVDIDTSAHTAYKQGGFARKAITTLSGLGHLEGKLLSVLANGNVVSTLTVSSGSITLPNKASRVHVGLAYNSDLVTLDMEMVSPEGTTVDKKGNIKEVILRLKDTRAVFIGPSEDRLTEIKFRTNEDYDAPTRLFSGLKTQVIKPGDNVSRTLFMRNSLPLPLSILSITAKVLYGEN